MLKRYRVSDDNAAGWVGRTDKYAVDGLVRVFEGVEDEFTICEVFEAEVWACHAAEHWCVGITWASTTGAPDRNRDARQPTVVSAPLVRHFLFCVDTFCWYCLPTFDHSVFIYLHSRFPTLFLDLN
jgi:hypothetical protein